MFVFGTALSTACIPHGRSGLANERVVRSEVDAANTCFCPPRVPRTRTGGGSEGDSSLWNSGRKSEPRGGEKPNHKSGMRDKGNLPEEVPHIIPDCHGNIWRCFTGLPPRACMVLNTCIPQALHSLSASALQGLEELVITTQ